MCTLTSQVDRIIFCVFLNIDYSIYCELLQQYFPPETPRAWEKEEKEGEVEGSTGETRGEGSPATPVSSGDKEPAPTGEEREQLPTERGGVERDVLPILKKSVTEPGNEINQPCKRNVLYIVCCTHHIYHSCVALSPGHSHVFNVKSWDGPGNAATRVLYSYYTAAIYYVVHVYYVIITIMHCSSASTFTTTRVVLESRN